MSYEKGQPVYFKHPKHCWIAGTVVDAGKAYTCKVSDPLRKEAQQGEEIKKLREDDLHTLQADVLDEDVDDLLNLTLLHDSTLLRCLYIRYMRDVVYTNIGAIVVALNPFNFKIPHYMDDQMPKYLSEGPVIEKNIPHSWAQAHNTYNEMRADSANQCILISGESGAGKTEATKIVMKYLAQISCLRADESAREAGLSVGKKLASCSPILEAFGNAKTVRNDNSSRFGKFMKVKFTGDGVLVGAHTTKYLLEKSRIVTASPGERVYHAFYVVVRGHLRRPLALDDEASYKSINAGKCLHNNEFDTEDDFKEVCNAMSGVGMSESEIHSVWKVPAGVLSLQNVSFKAEGEGSDVDPATTRFVEHCAKTWQVNEATLRHEFATTTITLPGNRTITKPNSVTSAIDTRDALCKAAYDGIFGWLVDKCNSLCDVDASGNWIGLLDIFGFEDFEKNSFEQICINLTNETLQNHYNSYIFDRDMQECRAEGIDVTEIKCPDNGPCLKMIAAKGGILPLLDEECSLGQGSDLTFLEKATSAFDGNPFFGRSKVSRDTFVVHHYAASVTYDVNSWLEKNRDTLKDAVKLLMRESKDALVSLVLPEPVPLELQKGKALTVGGFFNSQLADLMAVINSTNPHWIRCIKPHPAKKPRMFDGMSTSNQLESSGVLGTVKIRKAGYPVRIAHQKFISRYVVVTESASPVVADILAAGGVSDKALAQVGTTKVFLKSEAYQKLEKLREAAVVKWAYKLQRFSRGYQARNVMFAKFVDKNRERLLRERKEKEEAERAERERVEAERRAVEERERAAREAEERRRRAEEQKMLNVRNKAATCLQRHVRGGLTRIRIFRQVVEQQRAVFEVQRERQMVDERQAVLEVDFVRLKAERQWIAWLNEVDQLQRYMEQEAQRREGKEEQKKRILRREVCRAEEKIRRELILEEAMSRQTIITKCAVLARHKEEQARALASYKSGTSKASGPKETHRRLSPTRTQRQSQAHASARRNDQRTDKLLAEYALNRARAFEEYFPDPPPPPVDTIASRARAWEDKSAPRGVTSRSPAVRGVRSPQRDRELFERSKNRWERQEAWLDSNEAATTREFGVSVHDTSGAQPFTGQALAHQPIDDAYAGPFRTPQAAVGALGARSPPRNPLPAYLSGGTGSRTRPQAASPAAGGASPLPGHTPASAYGPAASAAGQARPYTAPRFHTPASSSGMTAAGATGRPNPLGATYADPSWAGDGAGHRSSTPRSAAAGRGQVDWDSVFAERVWH